MKPDKKKALRKRIQIISAILKLLLLLVILAGIPLYIYFFQRELISTFSSVENVNAFFKKYEAESVFVYIGLQIIQIIICIIPGQWLQFAAGYLFGFWLGFLYSVIGAVIGSFITYYLAKLLGHDAMHLIFGEEKVRTFVRRLNSKRAIIIVFLIFLIPGIPKDLCSYAAGLSEMKLKPFLIVSTLGRTPGMMGSLLIGKQIEQGSYTGAIIIGVIAVVLFILGIIMHKRLTAWLDKAYNKLYSLDK